MISSLSIVFLATCYLFFKQHYKKIIQANFEDTEENKTWTDRLSKTLRIFPLAIIIIIALYMLSSTISFFAPTLDEVKFVRRLADVGTLIICVILFYLDKKKLDKMKAI